MTPGIVALLSPESAAWIVNPYFPAVVGSPETVPSSLRDRPGGRTPAVTVQWYGLTPPSAVKETDV